MSDSNFRILTDSSDRPGTIVENGGVHFGYYAQEGGSPELLLYRKGSREVEARIPFPKESLTDGLYRMKVAMKPSMYEYNFYENGQVVTDPYAKKIVGRKEFGAVPETSEHEIRGGFVTKRFDWEHDARPQIPYREAIMYQLHVRGFTKQKNSGVRKKGTFAGLREKLPYLKTLGVNQIRLMPSYEFAEMVPRITEKELRTQMGTCGAKAAEKKDPAVQGLDKTVEQELSYRKNYWGYGSGFYFAPKASYAASNDEDVEFKQLVRAAHELGMEIVMEFCFTEETDILLIGECLKYWAGEYHVDGFAVIGRGALTEELARLPVFRSVKLICGWLPEHTVEQNRKNGSRTLLAESNDGFMNDCRRMLKGDEDMTRAFTNRLRRNPDGCSVINYITHHDGFTLEDLVSYDRKHNLENGEQDRDGTDYNYSWNCGAEGPTKRKDILRLRQRQKKNALAMLLFAQGTPMLLAGDECGNAQDGNNNPYCHDSALTWIDWKKTASARELTSFVAQAVSYRQKHPVLHQKKAPEGLKTRAGDYPDLSYHGNRAWYCEFEPSARYVGCMYTGSCAGESGFLYIAYNLYWTDQEFALPILPKGSSWYKVMDTSEDQSFLAEAEVLGRVKTFCVPPRTIMILEGRENEAD